MPFIVNNIEILVNEEGFMSNKEQWSEAVCDALAKAHSIEMTDAHWQVIHLLRDFCSTNNKPPSMRVLSGQVKIHLGEAQAKSIYLMKLFGSSPAKMSAKLAGLAKPKNCL